MPIINGQKMACAPCIRGHRSTKCNHFYERVMVPVRKPGRPLSTCPCPPGRPCSCGGVRVAIPKKQKCGCPSGAADEDEVHEKEPSPAETPTSPSRASFRVSKTNGSRASSRKQSFDPANLDRMDPRSINLIAAASSNGNGIINGMAMAASTALHASQTDLNGFPAGLGMVPAGSSSGYGTPQTPSYGSPFPHNMGFQYAPSPQLQHPIKMEDSRLYSISNGSFPASVPPHPFINGNHTPTTISSPPQTAIPSPSTVTKTNGASSGSSCCCGSKAQAPPPVPAPAQVPAPTPAPRPPVPQQGYGQAYSPQLTNGGGNGGSCCSNKAQPPSTNGNGNHVSTPQQGYTQPFMSPFQLPTVFTYPGDYGSWQHPIDPVIWQQVASQTGMPAIHEGPLTAGPTNGTADAEGTSHQCTCGEGCQCVGCLAHPFNAQMFQYVNNAYSGSNGSSPGATDGGSAGSTGGGGVRQQQQPVQTGAVNGGGGGHGAGQESPAEAPTPAGSEGSPGREEPLLSGLDYYFVNLPASGLCGGLVESCPCGDSCECAGCLVHNIPEVAVGGD